MTILVTHHTHIYIHIYIYTYMTPEPSNQNIEAHCPDAIINMMFMIMAVDMMMVVTTILLTMVLEVMKNKMKKMIMMPVITMDIMASIRRSESEPKPEQPHTT